MTQRRISRETFIINKEVVMRAELDGKEIEVVRFDLIDDYVYYTTKAGEWKTSVHDIVKKDMSKQLKETLKCIYPDLFL